MDMEHVYHFSCTTRLPWILKAGELRPGANRKGKPREYLWATSQLMGAATSAGFNSREAFENGTVLRVRFTLLRDHFMSWSTMKTLHTQWTPDLITRLEKRGREIGDSPDNWYCREQPLPLGNIIAIHTRGCRTPWQSFPFENPILLANREFEALGVTIGQWAYFSTRIDIPGHPIGYGVRRMALYELEGV